MNLRPQRKNRNDGQTVSVNKVSGFIHREECMKIWATKSGQKIYRIAYGRCNCYLIASGGKYLLVDTGRKSSMKKLKRRLDKTGVKGSSLAALILTHSHFDHAENAAYIKNEFGTKVIIHRSEAEFLKNGENPLILGTVFITGFLTEELSRKVFARYFRYRPVEPDILAEDMYDLNVPGFNCKIIHTPGHTPGSLSVIVGGEIAITGDTMFGVFPGSVFPLFAQDTGLLVRSWKKLLDTGCELYLPAHGSERSREILQRQYVKYSR